MRTAIKIFIPIVLHASRGVVSLHTSSSSDISVHKLHHATKRITRQHLFPDESHMDFFSDETHIQQALSNYEEICEIPVDTLIDSSYALTQPGSSLKQWASIDRGKDLFLRGMGRFNIPRTYDKLVTYRHRVWKKRELKRLQDYEMEVLCDSLGIVERPRGAESALTETSSAEVVQIALCAIREGKSNIYLSDLLQGESSTDGLPYWFVRVSLLQTWGYFGNALEKMAREEIEDVELNLCFLLDLPADTPQRQHLIKYHHSWSEQENLASLDEITRATEQEGFWPEGWERMRPSALLNSLREHEREIQLAEFGGEVTYSHLSELEDCGSLRVLRNSREIMDVGLALKNCALAYAEDVGRQECILIAKYDNVKKNKPIALGMIDQYGNVLSKRWSQIYMSCNRAAPREVKQEFYEYEAVLRPWFRKKYMEKNDNQ